MNPGTQFGVLVALAAAVSLVAAYFVLRDTGALATLAGILPASFLLAHLGGEMATGETDRILYAALALGLLTAVLLAAHFVQRRAP